MVELTTNIEQIDKATFFKPKKSHTMIKDTFEDLYDKIEILNQRLKIIEGK